MVIPPKPTVDAAVVVVVVFKPPKPVNRLAEVAAGAERLKLSPVDGVAVPKEEVVVLPKFKPIYNKHCFVFLSF